MPPARDMRTRWPRRCSRTRIWAGARPWRSVRGPARPRWRSRRWVRRWCASSPIRAWPRCSAATPRATRGSGCTAAPSRTGGPAAAASGCSSPPRPGTGWTRSGVGIWSGTPSRRAGPWRCSGTRRRCATRGCTPPWPRSTGVTGSIAHRTPNRCPPTAMCPGTGPDSPAGPRRNAAGTGASPSCGPSGTGRSGTTTPAVTWDTWPRSRATASCPRPPRAGPRRDGAGPGRPRWRHRDGALQRPLPRPGGVSGRPFAAARPRRRRQALRQLARTATPARGAVRPG